MRTTNQNVREGIFVQLFGGLMYQEDPTSSLWIFNPGLLQSLEGFYKKGRHIEFYANKNSQYECEVLMHMLSDRQLDSRLLNNGILHPTTDLQDQKLQLVIARSPHPTHVFTALAALSTHDNNGDIITGAAYYDTNIAASLRRGAPLRSVPTSGRKGPT